VKDEINGGDDSDNDSESAEKKPSHHEALSAAAYRFITGGECEDSPGCWCWVRWIGHVMRGDISRLPAVVVRHATHFIYNCSTWFDISI
jgi:hypothetical protein